MYNEEKNLYGNEPFEDETSMNNGEVHHEDGLSHEEHLNGEEQADAEEVFREEEDPNAKEPLNEEEGLNEEEPLNEEEGLHGEPEIHEDDNGDPERHAFPEEADHAAGSYEAAAPESRERRTVKEKRGAGRVVALALCCGLLGAAAGGAAGWAVGNRPITTEIGVSGRTAAEVVLKEINGQQPMSDAEVYAANVNSVVSINVTGTSGYNLFGQPVQTASAGSGFILTRDGYIVTNQHVISGAETVKVTLYNGDTYDASVIGSDEEYDIGVIKIEAEELQPVTLGDSSMLNVGDHVLAIGNPLGELTFSMSGGMVSCVNRAINVSGTPFNMIQTDTSINPGNSGGPLINSYGEVIGIITAKYSSDASSGTVEGLGFAIPINDVYAMIQDIMTNGYVANKPYLGITGGSMTEQMAAQYRFEQKTGVFVYSVEVGGAAANAGLRMGDVITKVDDHTILSMSDLTAVKKYYSAGDTAVFTFVREGSEQTAEVTWGAVPQEEEEEEAPQQSQNVNPYQNGNGYPMTPFGGMFEYFFGNGFGGGY